MSEKAISRRGAVAAVSIAVIGAAVGAYARPSLAAGDLLRPPGSLAEDTFLARCIKCQRCISVCPENILKCATLEDGIIEARTPIVDFSSGYCTFCELCRDVCPTAAIQTVDPFAPAEGRLGVAQVHTDRCLAFVEPGSCGICIDACQYSALSFDNERRPTVEDGLCNGCGQCESVCPANVLTRFESGDYRGIEVVPSRVSGQLGGDS